MAKKNIYLLLILILALRLIHLNKYGIWHDEKASVSSALGIPYGILAEKWKSFDIKQTNWKTLNFSQNQQFTSKDFWKFNHLAFVYEVNSYSNPSLLYSTVLHGWINLFGVEDFSVRFVSVIFGILTIFVVYKLALLLTNSDKIALGAAFFMAIHPIHLLSSQFARSHAMTCFFTTLSTYFLFKIVLNPTLKKINLMAIWYGLACVAAMLCHYFAVYIFLAHGMLILFFYKEKIKLLNFFVGGSLAVGIFSIWLVAGGTKSTALINEVNANFAQAAAQWKEGDNAFFMPVTFKNLVGAWLQVILPQTGNFLQNFGLRIREISVLLLLLITILAGLYFSNNKKLVGSLIILVFSHLLFATIVALKGKHLTTFQPFYTVYTIPFVCILLAISLANYLKQFPQKRFIPIIVSSVIIVIALASVFSIYQDCGKNRLKNPYLALAQSIKKNYQKGGMVIFPTWIDAQLTNLYLKEAPDILQQINDTSHEQVILHTPNGNQVTLLDFQKSKVRF